MKGDRLYDIEDVQEILGIGRTRAYELVKKAYSTQEPFKVLKIGRLYRIPKKPFDDWMDGNALLFTPCPVTRFAMHRIYANRINSRGMSRVFCDLCSQKTPRGILPVNSNGNASE